MSMVLPTSLHTLSSANIFTFATYVIGTFWMISGWMDMGFAQRMFSDERQLHKDLRRLQRRYRYSSTVTYSRFPPMMGNGVQTMLSRFWRVSSMEIHRKGS